MDKSNKSIYGQTLSTPLRALALALLYLLGGLLGKASAFMGGQVSLVWPPAGIALAAILLFGYRMWWGVMAGALLFTFVRGSPSAFFTVATAIGNTVGAVTCAYLLERFVSFRNPMERIRHAVGFIFLACILGTTVNATFNVLGLCYAGQLRWDELFSNVIIWWVPNALGTLVVTPAILTWSSPPSCGRRQSLLEAFCCAAGLIIGTQVSFNSWFVNGVQNYPLAYLPYPFLIWAALRFGQRGGTLATLIVAALSILELLHHRGPFLASDDRTSLMLIGCYIGIVAVTNLLLAGAAGERELAVRDTADSEKRYRGVVEDQSDLICRFLRDGTLTFVNQAYCRFHGKSREQLIGSNFFPGLTAEDREIPLEEFARQAAADAIQTFDNKITLPNGQFVWQQCSVRALFAPGGGIAEFQAVLQDITRRKESEGALRLGEERLRAILHSMVDGVIVLDAKGAVTLFNPAAEEIFQRRGAAVLNRPFSQLIADGHQHRYEEYLERDLGTIPPKIVELEAALPGEASRPIDLAVSQISRGGAVMQVVVVRDISERKLLEDQFRQSQKMEAVGRLAGGIAHDFNNLMQAILGYVNLLDRRLPANDSNRATVGQIQKSVSHATSLTRQLLAFSRKQVLKPKVLPLNGVVGEMEDLLRRTLGETVELHLALAEPAPWVQADRGQMEQIILNLAINARDAMPEGGILGLSTENICLTEEAAFSSGRLPPGGYAVLNISDSGCGMTADVQSHLFEPFFTTKGPGKGTGLGLSNVYGIVKQSGGEISVASAPGQGTMFSIYLPRCAGCGEEEETTHLTALPGGGSEVVLLVEDEDLVRTMLVEVLKSAGYKVLEARQGSEAIAVAHEHETAIDLLVTDMTMPGFSGLELARRLSGTRPRMRVLFISGYTDQEASGWSELNQPLQFLQKPFHPDTLLSKARHILDRQVA